jgi:hypothetical protein
VGAFDLNNGHFGFDLLHLSETPQFDQSVVRGAQVQNWQMAGRE